MLEDALTRDIKNSLFHPICALYFAWSEKIPHILKVQMEAGKGSGSVSDFIFTSILSLKSCVQ